MELTDTQFDSLRQAVRLLLRHGQSATAVDICEFVREHMSPEQKTIIEQFFTDWGYHWK